MFLDLTKDLTDEKIEEFEVKFGFKLEHSAEVRRRQANDLLEALDLVPVWRGHEWRYFPASVRNDVAVPERP